MHECRFAVLARRRATGLVTAVVLLALGTPGCAGETARGGDGGRTSTRALAGTEWRLIEIQSMDDAIGTVRPDDPAKYTLALGADGTAAMRLDCNRGSGRWSATPGPSGASGTFRIGPLAVTRAMCPPPSLDARIARDMGYVRSYLLADGRLHLSLMADGGIYVWEPDTAAGSP